MAHDALDHVAHRDFGVITGVMLAFARVAGETAPLLFTAFGNSILELEVGPADCCAAVADFQSTRFRHLTSGIARRGRVRWC